MWFYEKVWGIARLRLKEGEEEEKRGGAGAGAGGVGEGGGEAKGVKGVDGGWEKANKVWRGRLEEVLKGMVRELIGADGKKAEAGYQKAKTGEGKEEDKGEKGNEKEKQPGKEKGKK